MPAMYAYLDDFGKVSIWMNKNFYGGRSDYFSLLATGGESIDLIVYSVEEHESQTKYVLTSPADIQFGKNYSVRESHGLIVPLQFRMIVNTEEFNRMFYYDGDDLGATYHRGYTDFALWAPTAVSITLQTVTKGVIHTYPMERSHKGVWRKRVTGNLEHTLYCYLIERNGKVVKSLDPYAFSSNGNAQMSAVINLEKIQSVEKIKVNGNVCGTDAIIYETSVRDMTSSKKTGTKTNGKYVSLCEEDTMHDFMPTGLNYLSKLGVTHIQLMPVHDFCTVDEFHPEKNYNWGYDPMQYLSLEGSYSTDPDDPYSRMLEFRKMVSCFHKHQLRVNMDVVFNHTYDVDSCCFNCVVPYYYYRYNEGCFLSNGSYCGNDFASEKPMARKYLVHVIESMIQLYDVDGFRFDLMGILDVETMNQIHDLGKKLKKDFMVYGEGWDLPTMLDYKKKASIMNQNVMPEIGHFNDYFRDVIKGKTSDDQKASRGYITGDTDQAFSVLSAITANVMGDPLFKRFEEPDQTINNIETHDNATVWDKMHACCSNEDRQTRKERQKMMILTTLISQGIPFLHAGCEFCGTKNDNGNSYNAGDKINQMDWERAEFYKDIIEYTKKCIALRKEYKQFRLHTTEEIMEHVKVSVSDGGIVFYDIFMEDKKHHIDAIRVVFNPSFFGKEYDFEPSWKCIFDEFGEEREEIGTHVEVPALSIRIFERMLYEGME